MVISSFVGVGVIGISMLHVAKQLYCGNESRMSSIGKHSNMAVFVSFLVVCVTYSILKTDLVMPVGPKGLVSCDFGYLICWWSYYISKVCLWCCFMVRIDMTFHTSALAYKRTFLAALTVMYMLLQFAAMAVVLYFGIFQVGTEFVMVPSLHLGVCTTKVFVTEHFPVYLYGAALYAVLEIVFQLLVCFLFVSKLRKVLFYPKKKKKSK
ncbi:hypothetical protein RFI_16901 [Reticulomyxa filosa]|uniref:Uncharacterized protein n=1 Tax=Reticulomyxa filosa TaxID=46433 RepID=X6N2L0_RETFI|nr:hypothetical protein RFI_16901 [Reticulomyxa filosa]|eukprot:ETO20316.1 hypothetical protein RFI_16901 [Reticulomyxa filosa]